MGILRTPSLPSENPADYMRRRNREATAFIRRHGSWSTSHCKRVLSWEAHLRRPLNRTSWAAVLLDFRGAAWLDQQRLLHSSAAESRTRTRATRFVATRWHDGVKYAR